jgi:hypothetical protein
MFEIICHSLLQSTRLLVYIPKPASIISSNTDSYIIMIKQKKNLTVLWSILKTKFESGWFA